MDAANLYQIGRQAWPGIELSPDAFAAHVADRAADPRHAAELYLCCACARGDARAVAQFEVSYLADARAAVLRIVRDLTLADDALQLLRTKLFVADHRPPGINGYAGRGDLRGWLRVAATRVALGLMRARRAEADESELAQLEAPGVDPELALIRQNYGAEANAALQAAFAELSPRDRNLLRQHYVDGLGIDRLGRLYGIHRATAARWLDRARTALEKRTRNQLMSRLGVGPSTVESLVAMIRSELHLSLSGC